MYAVSNYVDRINFEKKNLIPYGYANAVLFNKFIDALGYLKDLQEQYEYKTEVINVREYVIEYIKYGESVIVYKGTYLYH